MNNEHEHKPSPSLAGALKDTLGNISDKYHNTDIEYDMNIGTIAIVIAVLILVGVFFGQP